jgi:rhamnosyltransferase
MSRGLGTMVHDDRGERLVNDSVLDQARIIVPVRNGGSRWREAAAALRSAVDEPSLIAVVDSSSTDGSDAVAVQHGFELQRIEARTFNHGRTRQEAVERFCTGKQFAVFLTQDAILTGRDALVTLLAAFADPRVGAAYGRQLPHHNAAPFEAHAILFRFGAASETRSLADVPRLGYRTPALSNAFAAYRIAALTQCGGFPHHIIQAEDLYVGMRMILDGWSLRYCSDAVVRHSHRESVWRELGRYFDLGVMHVQAPEFLRNLGNAERAGVGFILAEMRFARSISPWLLPEVAVRNVAKYVAYRLGRSYDRLPLSVCRALSYSKHFWDSHRDNVPAQPGRRCEH